MQVHNAIVVCIANGSTHRNRNNMAIQTACANKLRKWMSYSRLLAIKNSIYILTLLDRKTRCLLGWAVVWERTQEAIQQMIDEAPKAKWYYSDGFDAYSHL
jgi:transposase InsO family protein